jgi:aromatic-L-amino-acid decarboxylase
VKIAVDDEFRLRSDALEVAIEEDLKAGRKPFCVVATVGTTSTTSVDPVPEIADICQRYGLWLHVDAAYAGAAALLPEKRWALAGCERADSIVMNPHKWLFVPLDCSAFYCRHPGVMKQAFSLVPEYLRTPEEDRVRNFMDYGIQLGRRFRALKLWIELRYFGLEGLRRIIGRHIELAAALADGVDADPDWERLAPVPFSTVCLRWRPARFEGHEEEPAVRELLDERNAAIIDAVNRTGEVFLSHTRLAGRFTIRVSVGGIRTEARHVERAWDLLRREAARLDGERPIDVRSSSRTASDRSGPTTPELRDPSGEPPPA